MHHFFYFEYLFKLKQPLKLTPLKGMDILAGLFAAVSRGQLKKYRLANLMQEHGTTASFDAKD